MTDNLREKIINAGRVLVDEGQGDYVWGHISARLPDDPNKFLMKPGCVGIEEMTDGQHHHRRTSRATSFPANGRATTRSTSTPRCCARGPDVNCVIHTHPEHAIAFSSLGKPLPPMSNDGTMFSAGVPMFSETTDLIINQERGKAVAKTLGQSNIMILRNHGIVAAGPTIEQAVFIAIKLERACRIQLLAETGRRAEAVRQGRGACRQARPHQPRQLAGQRLQLSGPALAPALRLRGAEGVSGDAR